MTLSENFYIRPVAGVAEMQACQQIHRQVWGFGPEDTVIHLPLMAALQKYGGLLLGAFSTSGSGGEALVGFSLSFVGRDPATKEYFHYSQLTAALPEWQSQGIGFALKLAQRQAVLKEGYRLIRWAYDPLESRNAFFNLAKLGGVCRDYVVNMYGPGRGELFGQLDTDRLIVDWELDAPRVVERLDKEASPHPAASPAELYREVPGVLEVAWQAENIPEAVRVNLSHTERRLKLEIPYRNRLVQQHDYALAVKWREQTRTAFTHYLKEGYYIAGFYTTQSENRTHSYYLLEKKN
ncbi:MAG TPA: hypothetical protein VH186_31610 [Chloroflexia bacterium]|nr:hypothetical protein [Chloroflexia bacterium]